MLLAGNLCTAALLVSQAAAQPGSSAAQKSPVANASYFERSDVFDSFKGRPSRESETEEPTQTERPNDKKTSVESSEASRTHTGSSPASQKTPASPGKSKSSVVEFISNVLPSSEPQNIATPLERTQRSDKKSRSARTEQLNVEGNGAVESQPQTKSPGQPSAAEARVSNRDRDPLNLLDKIKRLGLATFLVLAGCFACLLVAKKFGVTRLPGNSGQSKINVIETKRLSSRCLLKLVQIESSQFLIAVDNSGVKSVQPVNKSFPETFEELNQEVVTESTEVDNSARQSSRLSNLIGKW